MSRAAALLLLGHGSTLNADSSGPTYQHAEALRRRGAFAEVQVGFWKEEPNFRQALRQVACRDVFVVPNFISSGYFTEQIIPRELGLTGPISEIEGHRVFACAPVGLHEAMRGALLQRAHQVVANSPEKIAEPSKTACLFICGHGTNFNDNSTKIIYEQAAAIRAEGIFADCQAVLMEQTPFVKDWRTLTSCPDVIVVPFFISDGLHSYEDIPVLLGLTHNVKEQTFLNPHREGEGEIVRRLWYASAIGTEPFLAEVILAQVQQFEQEHSVKLEDRPEIVFCAEEEWHRVFNEAKSYLQIGQLILRRGFETHSYILCHEDDLELDTHRLTELKTLAEIRELIRLDKAGNFRPLRAAQNLVRGWKYGPVDLTAIIQALDYFYPAAVANWSLWKKDELPVTSWAETAQRQTGRFRIIREIDDEAVRELVAQNCAVHCGKKRLWAPVTEEIAATSSAVPILCPEACNYLTGKARERIKEPGEE